MKNTTSILREETKELRVVGRPTLGTVLFVSIFWVLMIIFEGYIWIFHTEAMCRSFKDMTPIWFAILGGMAIMSSFLVWLYARRYIVRVKWDSLPTMYEILISLFALWRLAEVIMLIHIRHEFAEWWAEGYLPFILLVWIAGATGVLASVILFLRKEKYRRRRRNSRNWYSGNTKSHKDMVKSCQNEHIYSYEKRRDSWDIL